MDFYSPFLRIVGCFKGKTNVPLSPSTPLYTL